MAIALTFTDITGNAFGVADRAFSDSSALSGSSRARQQQRRRSGSGTVFDASRKAILSKGLGQFINLKPTGTARLSP